MALKPIFLLSSLLLYSSLKCDDIISSLTFSLNDTRNAIGLDDAKYIQDVLTSDDTRNAVGFDDAKYTQDVLTSDDTRNAMGLDDAKYTQDVLTSDDTRNAMGLDDAKYIQDVLTSDDTRNDADGASYIQDVLKSDKTKNAVHIDGTTYIQDVLKSDDKSNALEIDGATYIQDFLTLVANGQTVKKINKDKDIGQDGVNRSATLTQYSRRMRRSEKTNCQITQSCENISTKTSCRCEKDCGMYRECCFDANVTEHSKSSLPVNVCRPYNSDRNVWMLAGCPESFTNKEIAEKCRTFSVESGDPYQIIPVHSFKHHTLFQNRYCALCNDVDMNHDLSQFDINVLGFENGCKNTQSRNEYDFLLSLFKNSNCKIEYALKKEILNDIRSCPNVIDTCPQSFLNSRSNSSYYKCVNGPYTPVWSFISERTYRNEHCFNCNHNYSGEMKCGVFRPPLIVDMLPLRVVLNVSYVQQVIKGISPKKCQRDEVFDSASVKCRRVYCGPDQIFVDGGCKQMITRVEYYSMNFSYSFQFQPSFLPMNEKETFIRSYLYELYDDTRTFSVELDRITIIESPKYCSVALLNGTAHHVNARSKTIAIKEIKKYLDRAKFDSTEIIIQGVAYRMNIIDSSNIFICPPKNQSIIPYLLPKFEPLPTELNQKNICPYVKLDLHDISLFQTDKNLLIENENSTSNLTEYSICLSDFKTLIRSNGEAEIPLSLLQMEVILTYSIFVFSCLSGIFFLILYIVNPNIRTLPANTIFNLVFCTVLVQISYVVGIGVTEIPTFCKIIGIIIHYLFLCNFIWSVICAVHMFRVFRKIQLSASAFHPTTLFKYMVLGYGLPGIYVGIFLVGEICACYPLYIEYGGNVCFLNSNEVIIYAIDLPVLISLVVNVALFIAVARKIRNQTLLQNSMSRKERNNFMICLRIVSAMNFSWALGMIAKWTALDIFWVLFTIINGLQGFFLLLSFMNWKNVVETFKNHKKKEVPVKPMSSTPIYECTGSTTNKSVM